MKIKSNVAISESGFVFDPFSGESYSVNPIGAEVFNSMKADKSYEEISAELMEKYQVEAVTLEKDLHDFFEMLKHYQLIEEETEDGEEKA